MGRRKTHTESTEAPPAPETTPAAERKPAGIGPNPRTWNTNRELGTEFRTRTKPYEAQIAFCEKPSQSVIDYLKEQGFHWSGQDKAWAYPIGFESQEQDRLHARRTYAEVKKLRQKEKGISAGAEVSF